MLDCGTKAEDYAILKLYKYMDANKLCGGCCGEIEVDLANEDEVVSNMKNNNKYETLICQ